MCVTHLEPFGWNVHVALSLYKGPELEVRKNSQVYFAKQRRRKILQRCIHLIGHIFRIIYSNVSTMLMK